MGLLDPPPFPMWDFAENILGETQTATDPNRALFRAAIRARDFHPPFKVDFPAGFTAAPSSWVPPFTILRNRAGTFYTTVRAHDLMPKGGIALYVDYAGGSDSNDGSTWVLAKKTVNGALTSTAYTTIPTPTSPATIYIRPGRYGLGESINSNPLLRDTNLVGIDGTPELSSANYGDRVTWTSEPGVGTGVWSTPYVAADGFNLVVFDEGTLDADSLPSFVKEVASGAGMSASSHRILTNKLYVRLLDSSKPGTRLAWAANNADTNAVTVASDGFKFYAENIRFAYGANAFHSSGNTGQVVLLQCEFFGGYNKGVESEKSHPTLTWIENCISRRNNQDGFSYRGTSRAVEVNCLSISNGYQATLIAAGSNNGSTAHDAARVVRIGGQYIFNADRNVHDITGCRSFNVGVTAGYTLSKTITGTTDVYASSNFVASYAGDPGVTTRMWCLECHSEGSAGDYNSYNGSIIYMKDCYGPVLTASGGTFDTF